jgi:hypothetical protein
MIPADYETYWETAAKNHKEILHTTDEKRFIRFSVEEVLTGLKSLKSPALVLEEPEYNVLDEVGDNVGLQLQGAVLILKKLSESANYIQIQTAKKEMFLIAYDMYTKLRNDRKMANMGDATGPAAKLKNISNIRMIALGPVFDGWHGWRLEYTSPVTTNPDLNEDNWNNETKYKI